LIRIRERRNELARFARNICRLVAEVLPVNFAPETLMQMANMPLPSQAKIDSRCWRSSRR